MQRSNNNQREWFNNNSDERQKLLNIIGAFSAGYPLTFFLKPNGQIGKICITSGTKSAKLEKQMWLSGIEEPLFPKQYKEGWNLSYQLTFGDFTPEQKKELTSKMEKLNCKESPSNYFLKYRRGWSDTPW